MIVFLDFEASSLSKKSYPIEVGWIFEDGQSASYLIKPALDWTDWSKEAQGIHGLKRDSLQREGRNVEEVAAVMLERLTGHDLFVSAPSWDGKWLSVLLRAAGHDRHALRLGRSDKAFADAARAILGPGMTEKELAGFVRGVIAVHDDGAAPAHRALADAKMELSRLVAVRLAAEAYAKEQAEPQTAPASAVTGSNSE